MLVHNNNNIDMSYLSPNFLIKEIIYLGCFVYCFCTWNALIYNSESINSFIIAKWYKTIAFNWIQYTFIRALIIIRYFPKLIILFLSSFFLSLLFSYSLSPFFLPLFFHQFYYIDKLVFSFFQCLLYPMNLYLSYSCVYWNGRHLY